MALLRLTDITLAQSTAITPTTLIHIVTTADTSQNGAGSSYKAQLGQIYDGLSAHCINDFYVSNIHSCSPLFINPLDEGNVYFGSTSAVTVDLSNNRLGIGTTIPSKKLEVSGDDALIYGLTVGRGLGANVTNTVLGNNALNSNTTGGQNVSIGYQSLYSNTTGSSNIAIGGYSLYNNISASNIAIGYDAQREFTGNTGGNTSLGNNSLRNNKSGSYNVAIGDNTLYNNDNGTSNTAIGISALYNNTNGVYNVAIGINALTNNTTGNNNFALGAGSLSTNTFGSSNIAIGISSLLSLASGNSNISIGNGSMTNAVGGSDNIGIGRESIKQNISGVDNISLGQNSLSANTTGDYNICLGRNSMFSNQTGSNNITIGQDSNVGSSNLTNAIAIGYNSVVNTSNSMVLGNNNVNVGIGTSSPSEKLHVSGDTLINSQYVMLSDTINPIPTISNFRGFVNIQDYNKQIGYSSLNSNSSGETGIYLANDSSILGQIEMYGSNHVRQGFPLVGVNFYRNKMVISTNNTSDGMVIKSKSDDPSATLWFEIDGASNMVLKGDGNAGSGNGFLGLRLNPDGTEMPSSNLQIGGTGTTGTFKYRDGNQQNGYVLTSDASGNASWSQSPPFTGGTVTGSTNFTGGVSANTISATTYQNLPTEIQVAASDETTALTTGTAKVTFRMPYAMTVTEVRGSLTTAQTSGSIFTVDINESGTSILSTKLTIDNTEKTSVTAATPPVISDTSLADDSEITVDIDQVGDGTATGLKITIKGFRA